MSVMKKLSHLIWNWMKSSQLCFVLDLAEGACVCHVHYSSAALWFVDNMKYLGLYLKSGAKYSYGQWHQKLCFYNCFNPLFNRSKASNLTDYYRIVEHILYASACMCLRYANFVWRKTADPFTIGLVWQYCVSNRCTVRPMFSVWFYDCCSGEVKILLSFLWISVDICKVKDGMARRIRCRKDASIGQPVWH